MRPYDKTQNRHLLFVSRLFFSAVIAISFCAPAHALAQAETRLRATTADSINAHDEIVGLTDDQLFNDSLPVAVTNQETATGKASGKNTAEEDEGRARTEPSRLREELTQPPDIKRVVSLTKLFWTAVFLLVGYFAIKAISGLFALFAHRKPRYKGSIRRLLPMVKIIGWSFIVYVIITLILQPPMETIFAFFASVGVAIGFASQDFLKNIFGGLMILFDKPFQIGDKIESGKYYGEVLEIGLRSTRVVTPDDSVVTIPNSEMMNQSISNSNYGENNCQVVAELFLPLNIDTQRVRQIATEAAQVSKYVYLNKPIMVEFSNVLVPRGSFLKMRLKAYVMDVRYEFPFQSEMTEIVVRELHTEGLLKEV